MTKPNTGSEYTDALRDVMDHVAEAEAARPRPEPPKGPLLQRPKTLAGLFVALSLVVAVNFILARRPTTPLPTDVEPPIAGVSALVASQVVEAFRQDNGRLPESLEEAGLPDAGLEYTRHGEGYEIEAVVGDRTIRARSEAGILDLLGDMGPPDVAPDPGGPR